MHILLSWLGLCEDLTPHLPRLFDIQSWVVGDDGELMMGVLFLFLLEVLSEKS